MRIVIVTPVDVGSTRGNGVTARRWQAVLTELGHQVRLQQAPAVDVDCDLLVALHARKSAAAIRAFRISHPGRPVVLALTGTDLYGEVPDDPEVAASIADADRLVVLQPAAVAALPPAARPRAQVIRQSVAAARRLPPPPRPGLAVCVLAHLRAVKDPLLAARAVALLPPALAVRVTLAGAATAPEWARQATAEAAANPRFRWLGELSAAAARALMLDSDAIVVSSTMEGGANVVGEAIVAGVPVLASRIPGNTGMLGEDYPGYFPVGDAAALAALMQRAHDEPQWLAELAARLDRLRADFEPGRELAAWRQLLAGL